MSGTKIMSGMLFDSTPCEVRYVFRTCYPPTYYVNGNGVSLVAKGQTIMPGYPPNFNLLNDIKQYLKLGKNVIAVIATSDSNGKIASTVKIRMVGSPVSPTQSPSPIPTPTIYPTSTLAPTEMPTLIPTQTPTPTPTPTPLIQYIINFINLNLVATIIGGIVAGVVLHFIIRNFKK